MTVYVDKPQIWHNTGDRSKDWRYGASAHMLPSDPASPAALAELHVMAARLGMKREWFQNGRWPHYDLTATKQKKALSLGAVLVDTKTYIRMIKEKT